MAMARTWTAWSGDKRTDHEATTPPTLYTVGGWICSVLKLFYKLSIIMYYIIENRFQKSATTTIKINIAFIRSIFVLLSPLKYWLP